MDEEPRRSCGVGRCSFAASYRLSVSVNNTMRHNQWPHLASLKCPCSHAVQRALALMLRHFAVSSWITHPDPQILLPRGKSASFVYLQGWVISNNHSSQDRASCLSLSSRSSLALKCDLNVMRTHPRLAPILHRVNAQQTGFYFNSFYLRDTKHKHLAVVLFHRFSMHEVTELG